MFSQDSEVDDREEDDERDGLKMSEVMSHLFFTKNAASKDVSIHSAFICVLHIANEKGLLL